jgi:hypothetical protein
VRPARLCDTFGHYHIKNTIFGGRKILNIKFVLIFCKTFAEILLTLSGNERGMIIYTGCNRRNVPYFGRVFLMLNYTEKNQKNLYPKLNGYRDKGQRKVW